MPFGPPAFSTSARTGIGAHEPMDPVSGSGAGSGYGPYLMNLLGLNKKKPWTPGKKGQVFAQGGAHPTGSSGMLGGRSPVPLPGKTSMGR
jgi:hypothetical protein